MTDQTASKSTKRHRDRIVFWPRRLQRPTVDTIVIDTSSLVDIAHPTVHAHPIVGTSAELLQAAHKALVGGSTLRMIHLSKTFEPLYEHPVATYTRAIAGTSWHSGEHYICYWIGDVSKIIQRSDLTENERERLLTTARRMGSEGQFVYAVGVSTQTHAKDTDATAFLPQDLQCLGLISTDVRTHPNLTRSLALCRQQGISVVYASSDDELVVSSIAHRTKLLPRTTLPQRYHTSLPTDQGALCFAELTTEARRKIIANLDPRTTLVTDQPLPSVVQTIKLR